METKRNTNERKKPKNENLMLFTEVMDDAGMVDYRTGHDFLQKLGVKEWKLGNRIYVNRKKYYAATANI